MMVVQGQLDINEAEASSPSEFVAGWRPAIGWVCGAACTCNWIAITVVTVALAAPARRERTVGSFDCKI